MAQGFGRVHLRDTIGPFGAGTSIILHDEATALDTNQQEVFTQTIPAGAVRLKVTLVWSDPAGESLQNDLDLVVTAANGQEQHGNVPAGSMAFDRTNNVEQVVWINPPAGDAKITVRAQRVTLHPQSYALVIRLG